MDAPTTQVSLILRLRNPQDAVAWEEFVEVYQPTIYKITRQLVSEADTADACQEVLLRLSQAIHKWSPDSENASFRGWLYRVARNTTLRFLRQIQRQQKTLGITLDPLIGPKARVERDLGSVFDLEFSRQLFHYVAEKTRPEFDPKNWSAFWFTYVWQESIEIAAAKLGISKSRVYVARSRILNRLRTEVQRISQLDLTRLPLIESESCGQEGHHQEQLFSKNGDREDHE